MKRSICILFCISAIILSAGCSQEKDISADKTDELSTPIQEFIDDRYSSQTNTVIYPKSVEEVDSQHLRYKSRSELHPYSITFPNIFSVENRSMIFDPENGVYLSTEDGDATLQIEYVSSDFLTMDDFLKYLSAQYGTATLEVVEPDIVFLKTESTDMNNNTVVSYMKARVENNGYTEVILNYHYSDSNKYENMLRSIEIA